MLEPHLYLAFDKKEDAEKAMQEHLCLCRNEDIILPSEILELSETDFDKINGFELLFDGDENAMFKVGDMVAVPVPDQFGGNSFGDVLQVKPGRVKVLFDNHGDGPPQLERWFATDELDGLMSVERRVASTMKAYQTQGTA